MKKIKLLLGIVLVALTLGCEGSDGPPGPPGLDGLDGQDGEDALSAEVYEQTINFSFDSDINTWSSEIISFNGALDGDIYIGYVSLGDGLFTNLPASFFDEFGEFQYVFDHDFDSVQFQIIGDNDLSTLSVDFTDNVTTRIAIIPAELFLNYGLNNSLDIISLMQKMDINETDIILQ
ncbi:MAG: hypothetical protein AAGH81_15740 [Bacteroidota bacterium]